MCGGFFGFSDWLKPSNSLTLRPSWATIFMRAYSAVCAAHPPLRRAYIGFPRPHLYEHPYPICAMAVEREHNGEEGIFVGLYRAPAQATLADLDRPEAQLERLREFLAKHHPAHRLPDFWEWDAQHNPSPFQPPATARG